MVTIKNIPMPGYKYYIKCPYDMKPTRIVIHNTANDASAKNEIEYMHNNDNQTSYHYAVDDKEAIQGAPLDRNTWHAGDGANGTGNREGISIEICYSKSGGARFEKAQENAAELTAYLLNKYGWGMDESRITKHQDYSGKYCPHRTLDDYGWAYFINLVKRKYEELYEGEKPMTTAEKKAFEDLQKRVEAVETQCLPKWGYIDNNLPSWAKDTVKKLYQKGVIKGDSSGNLQLSYLMLRMLVILDRSGVFG